MTPPQEGTSLARLLRDAGLRATRPRMVLAELLFARGNRHVTAEMLYEETIAARSNVSLATVYNTLNQLTEAELCARSASTGPSLFSTPMWVSTTTISSRTRTRSWIFPPAQPCR